MASPWEQAKAGQKISAPKQSKYQGYQGQPGGSSSIPSQGKRDAFVNLQRQKFFGDRDIPEERVLRRTRQEGALNQFKDALVRKGRVASGVTTASGEPVYLTDVPGGRSVSDVAQNLAYRFGPTPREVFGDIGYGLGSIGKGIGDFIGRGGVLGSVASDLFQRIKSGTQQGIETVGGLYDNLRNVFKGESQFVTPQAQGGIFEGQPIETTPQFPYNFETIMKPKPDPLLPSEMSQEQFMESFPELYSSLYQQRNYEPIRVSDMNMTGVTAQEGDRPVLPENVVPRTPSVYPLPRNVVPMTPVLPPEVTDPRMYQGQTLYAENLGLPSLKQSYDFLRNPQVETPLGNLRFDNVLSGKPQLGYENTVMINGVPVDLNATIGNQGLSLGGSFSFKKGGSVDKYAGLGYKLK